MKNKNALYYLINFLFLAGAILLVNYTKILDIHFSIGELIILVVMLLIIHSLKFLRIYFILLEDRVPLKRMIKIYVKTTFASIIYPYKIGEIFKMYSFGNEVKSYSKGIIAVLIDKFFDAIILCSVLIPYEIIKNKSISNLSILLLAFIIAIIIIYLTFDSNYKYLNNFFVTKIKSKKSLIALRLLEKLNNIYKYAKGMLKGRQLILVSLTAIIWILESIFVILMELYMNMSTKFITIINYINDSFFGTSNILFNNYMHLCTLIFLIIMIYIYSKKIINGGRKFEKNSINI